MKKCFVFASVGVMAFSAVSMGDITGAYYSGRQVTATDFAGQPDFNGWVVDLFLTSDDATDTVLNVFNVNMSNSAGAASYYQSFTGTGWVPNNLGVPFETDALQHADSFVSMGGRDADGNSAYGSDGTVVQMAANGTGLDPAFGGNNAAAPGENAGWYNSNPPVAIGMPINGSVFIGRFALNGAGEFALMGTVSVTWNNGIGTPGEQAFDLEIVPAPGAFALLGLAGLARRRRRG